MNENFEHNNEIDKKNNINYSNELVSALDDENIIKYDDIFRVALSLDGGPKSEIVFKLCEYSQTGPYVILSPESPIGKAIMGKLIGDTCTVIVPAGKVYIDLLEKVKTKTR